MEYKTYCNGMVVEYVFPCPFEGSHVLSGKRPAILIVKDDILFAVPITIAHKAKKLPTHILLPQGIAGLKQSGLGLAESILTIQKENVVRVFGNIEPSSELWCKVLECVRLQFGIDFVCKVLRQQAPKYNQGDIVLIDRPCFGSINMILSNDACNETSPVITVAPLQVKGNNENNQLVNTQLSMETVHFYGKLFSSGFLVDMGGLRTVDKEMIIATVGSCSRKNLLEKLREFWH